MKIRNIGQWIFDKVPAQEMHKRVKTIKTLQEQWSKPLSKPELQSLIMRYVTLLPDDTKVVDLNWIDTSEIVDMSHLFASFPYDIDASWWDTSHVMDMSHMFEGYYHDMGDLSRWNVSRVVDMSFMFYDARRMKADISGWDVSYVRDMRSMLFGCMYLDCDLSRWDVSRVEDMYGMFRSCKSTACDLSSWDVRRVETHKAVNAHMGKYTIRLGYTDKDFMEATFMHSGIIQEHQPKFSCVS